MSFWDRALPCARSLQSNRSQYQRQIMSFWDYIAAYAWSLQPHHRLWIECLENVGSLTPDNSIGLHGLCGVTLQFVCRWCFYLTGNTNGLPRSVAGIALHFICRWWSYLTGNTLVDLHSLIRRSVPSLYVDVRTSTGNTYDPLRPIMEMGFLFIRFEAFTAMAMKNGVFWDVTPCGSCKNRRFGGT
jgi:hypothetical protein